MHTVHGFSMEYTATLLTVFLISIVIVVSHAVVGNYFNSKNKTVVKKQTCLFIMNDTSVGGMTVVGIVISGRCTPEIVLSKKKKISILQGSGKLDYSRYSLTLYYH